MGKTNLSCVLSDFHVHGNLTVDMHPLITRVPPFQYMTCYFMERPYVGFKLKFKDTAVGKVKVGHSNLGMGYIFSKTLKQKIIDEFVKSVVYPRNIEVKV